MRPSEAGGCGIRSDGGRGALEELGRSRRGREEAVHVWRWGGRARWLLWYGEGGDG